MIKSFDITTTCPLCGKSISWVNGSSNNGVVYIKNRARQVHLYHEKCIDNERMMRDEKERS